MNSSLGLFVAIIKFFYNEKYLYIYICLYILPPAKIMELPHFNFFLGGK